MVTELTYILTFQEYLNDCCETELADNEDEMLLGKILDFTIHLGVGSILCKNYGTASKLVQLLNGLYNNGRTYTVYIEQVGRLGPLPEGAIKGRPLGNYLFGYAKNDETITPRAYGNSKGKKSPKTRNSPKTKHTNGWNLVNFGLPVFQACGAVPPQHPERQQSGAELLSLQQEDDPQGVQVRVAGARPGLRKEEKRREEGTMSLLQVPDRWMGPKGPNRPPSKGRIKLYVYEPLPRRDHRCARLLRLEGGAAVNLGVVQGEGENPPPTEEEESFQSSNSSTPKGK